MPATSGTASTASAWAKKRQAENASSSPKSKSLWLLESVKLMVKPGAKASQRLALGVRMRARCENSRCRPSAVVHQQMLY
jgi:hypothetical protein